MKKRLLWGFVGIFIYPIVWILMAFLLDGELPKWSVLTGSSIGGFICGFFIVAPSIQKRKTRKM
ncbi:hypothetical protein [Bacillus sp. RAR_GA_16]|uniref:hypothetical protein n=1 Tax=Bacillus sp. RAR_GA_16 TaxID=2876774 RepID=UPI001CCA1241|nr:hypothetical protein [Bacillus sp. RAR_GA_16]MCA0172922.1 hypothetical protein [Bacillus sp. RAR_GA_16]